MAALFLDGGVEAARDFIYRTLIPRMSEDTALEPEKPQKRAAGAPAGRRHHAHL